MLLATGEEILERVDLEIPGIGMNFVFRRTYRSKVKFNGPLGHGWDFNWNDNLQPSLRCVDRQNGHGRPVRWQLTPNFEYEPPPGYFSKLVKRDGAAPDRVFVLRDPDGTKRFYDAQGRLSAWENHFVSFGRLRPSRI